MCGPNSSEADDKRLWHGALRAAERAAAALVRAGADPIWPLPREVSDPWGMTKDGKIWRTGSSWRYGWGSDHWVIRMMRK